MQTVSTMGRQCLLGAGSVSKLHGCFLLNPSEHTTSKIRLLKIFGLFHHLPGILLLLADRIGTTSSGFRRLARIGYRLEYFG